MITQQQHWCPYLASAEFEERLANAHQEADNSLPVDRMITHEEWAAAIIKALRPKQENKHSWHENSGIHAP